MMKRALMVMAMLAAAGCGSTSASSAPEESADGDVGEAASADGVSTNTQMARAGRQIFFDTNLSSPAGQSCATCHANGRMFTDPDTGVPTSEGVISGRFGFRNAQTLAYAAFAPALGWDAVDGGYSGGFFWDGRANSLASQAAEPFLNPLEMNNADKATVVAKVAASAYAPVFKAAFGATVFSDVNTAYDDIGKALQAFEQSRIFYPFTSKYDQYIAGKATLTTQEASGMAIYADTTRANCISCHPSGPDADGSVTGLFTDFGFDNLGIPKNPNNPYYSEASFNPAGSGFNDRGLGGTINDSDYDGAFKSPTLRNLGRTGPYMHNGYFSTLKDVVHFYNTRDVAGAGWPAPEFPATMNTADLGNLGLSDSEENDLVAFLGTLNDATPTINSTCTATKTYTIYNSEWPYHEVGPCAAPEFLIDEATVVCGGHNIKYYGYSCNNNTDGTHTWQAIFSCC